MLRAAQGHPDRQELGHVGIVLPADLFGKLEGHWWESLSYVHAGEGSSPGLLGFSRVPNGGASGSVATGMSAGASAVDIVPKPAGKWEWGRGGGGGGCGDTVH